MEVTVTCASTMYQSIDTLLGMGSSSIFSLPLSLILVLLASIAIIVGLPVVLVGLSVWVSTHRASKHSAADNGGATDEFSSEAVRRARIGRIGGLTAGAVIGIGTYFATGGILVPAFVAVGYLLGMLVFELRPSSQPTGPIRVASLQARSAWQYLPKWAIRMTIVVAVLNLMGSAVLAFRPPPGLSSGKVAELYLPFALAAWVPLMGKVARLPQPVSEVSEAGRLANTRVNAARAITGAVLGIELLSLASIVTASPHFINQIGHGTAYATFGPILAGLSIGLAIAGLVVWSILSRWRSVPVEPADPAPAGPRIA
jgi:hypothetical protein